MRSLDYLQAILLGVIQGATEFLPISSSAHLALAQWKLGLVGDAPVVLLLDALVHIATVFSVFYVFCRPGLRFASRLVKEFHPGYPGRRNALHIAWLAVVASIPTGVIGLTFQDFFEASFARPRQVAVELAVTGVLLASMIFVPRGRRGWRDFTWWQAGVVGVSQGIAILPGISRSGITICTASYFGLRRRWAAEFSFLIAIPAILGAAAIKCKDTCTLPASELADVDWGPLLVGSLVAMIVGVLALELLVAAVRRAKLHYFAPYCWAVAALVLMRR